jgi:hypothetical protein
VLLFYPGPKRKIKEKIKCSAKSVPYAALVAEKDRKKSGLV